MPSPKMLAWMAGVSLITVLALEKYRTAKAG
jgi:hypothetical protein